MSLFVTRKTSPARANLAETISAHHDAEAKLADINAARARLAEHESEVVVVERNLAELNAAEGSAALSWAKSGEGEAAPAPDVDRREEINRALIAARAQANAAAVAQSALESEALAAAGVLPGIINRRSAAIVQVIVDESTPLIAAAAEIAQKLATEKARLRQIFEYVRGAAMALPEGSREAVTAIGAMSELNDLMRVAFDNPLVPIGDIVANGAALREFAAALADDSSVSLAA
jgi:hypothetical protein